MTDEFMRKVLEDVKVHMTEKIYAEGNGLMAGHTYVDIHNAINTALKHKRRGQWKTKRILLLGVLYECSVCGGVNGDDSDYCPNCGADMRRV